MLICSSLTIVPTHSAWATQVSIAALEARAGEAIDVPIMIDEVDNLAGVKLIVDYDAKLLTFEKGTKGRQTSSLMHIINDKNPGRLIIVMAGAKGIKGKAFAILTLRFGINKGLKEKKVTPFKITGVELMSDRLKTVEAQVKVNPLTILPETGNTENVPQKPPAK